MTYRSTELRNAPGELLVISLFLLIICRLSFNTAVRVSEVGSLQILQT